MARYADYATSYSVLATLILMSVTGALWHRKRDERSADIELHAAPILGTTEH